MDAVASLYGRDSLLHIIEKTAREILLPSPWVGGLHRVEDSRSEAPPVP